VNNAEQWGLLPINYPGEHWALLLWQRKEGRLFYLDSLAYELDNFLGAPSRKKACNLLLKISEGSKERNPPEFKLEQRIRKVKVPKQNNSNDCGPLVLATIQTIIRNYTKYLKVLNFDNCSFLLSNMYKCEDEAKKIRNLF